jgi:hypothetical protein
MKLTPEVKADLCNLYDQLRDAQEVYREATKAVADKFGKKPKHVRQFIKLVSTGKMDEYREDVQMVLEL